MEFGRHAVLRGQFAFASTGSSPVGRTKYMPYVQAGEKAILKTVGRKRLAGSNPALPTIYYILGRSQAGKAQDFDSCMLWFESRRPSHFSGGVVSKLVKEMVCNTISAGSNPVNSSKILLL